MDGWMLGIHPRICIWEHVIDLVIFHAICRALLNMCMRWSPDTDLGRYLASIHQL